MDHIEVSKSNLISHKKSGREISWYGEDIEKYPKRRAAVLIPLFSKKNKVHVLLTRRSDNVRTHKRQISFPGGKCDDKDIDVVQTALRETYEEIGISTDYIEVVSTWQPLLAMDGKGANALTVYPVVGLLKPGFKTSLNDEVSEVFDVPLEFFLLDKSHLQHHFYTGETKLPIHYFNYEQGKSSFYIWGITGNLCLKVSIIALRKLPVFELITEVERQEYNGFVKNIFTNSIESKL